MVSFFLSALATAFLTTSVYSQCAEHASNDDTWAIVDPCMGRTQAMAQVYCDTEFGSDLATLDSRTVNRAAYDIRASLTSGTSYNAWIGATDEDAEDTWRWPNGDLVTYFAWFRNEPNNYGDGQDCAIMGSGSSRWDDQACDEEFYAFFCDNAGSGTVADPTRSPTARPSDNPTYRPSESPSDRPTDSPVANTWWARRG